MPEQTLNELFGKFICDKMSTDEFVRFRALVKDENNKEELERLVESAFADRKHMEMSLESYNNTISPVRALAGRDGADSDTISGNTAGRKWFRYAAACLVGGVLAAGAYRLLHSPERVPATAVVQSPAKNRQELAPGGNKATLTLADGTTIDLGKTGDGLVKQQGNTQVLKVGDGQLAYKRAGTAPGAVAYNTVSTPRGGQYQIILPDGTRVWLNAASSLRFPTAFTGEDRTVELNGEAYFEVTAKHTKPFTVQVGAMKVEALGTRFNIMAYKDEPAFKATLVQGSVRVSNGLHKVIIQPGSQAVLADAGNGGLAVEEADLQEVLAWKNGKFWLEDADIRSIMRQVGRWYDVDVQMNEPLPDVRLSGTVSRKEDAGELLDLLEESTGKFHFTVEGRKITVTASGK